jgi:predicted alpha-1,6-mannanase (GH76 family)
LLPHGITGRCTKTGRMGLTNEAASNGRHRRRRPAAWATTVIITLTALSVLGIGYVRYAGHGQTASPRPGRPGATAGDSPFTAEAAAAVARLQTKVGDAYTATHLWQAASALSATIGFMDATGSRTYLSDLSATYQAHHRGDTFRDNYYDDEGWWVLTWIKAYGLTGNRAYLRQAKSVFRALTKGWTPVCGGGLQWAHRRPYKNAITNETFMTDAALLHEATPGDTRYARWALRDWKWFSARGMLTRSGLVVDGLSSRCRPKLGSPTWTYNQGMLIGAMVSMAKMTGSRSFLVTAGRVARAVIRSPALSPHGILREPCGPRSCGRDAPMFKGIFIANLKLLYDRVGGAGYQAYMRRNAAAVWADDRRGSSFGLDWAGPFRASTITAQASALDLLTTQIPAPARPARP